MDVNHDIDLSFSCSPTVIYVNTGLKAGYVSGLVVWGKGRWLDLQNVTHKKNYAAKGKYCIQQFDQQILIESIPFDSQNQRGIKLVSNDMIKLLMNNNVIQCVIQSWITNPKYQPMQTKANLTNLQIVLMRKPFIGLHLFGLKTIENRNRKNIGDYGDVPDSKQIDRKCRLCIDIADETAKQCDCI